MTTDVKNPQVCCAVCGSIEVQYAIWYSPNTEETGECFGSWNAGDNTYCADCDMEGRDANPDLLVDLAPDRARFNELRVKRVHYEAKQED